ncbi:MAG: Gfo/Idh/MocA family oxidoreductase, partial [Candidatus Omnitrophica bacterium]|nr:Gfo/Idh/MocA family oxidoreductase [Candidatus Omnitrophota bacterium]
VGFNHRHHPAILKAKSWLDAGKLGEPLFVRSRYGICGRPGFEKEWRADPGLASGGQLMEQGIHAVDLARLFLGDFRQVIGFVETLYWKTEPLEDNGFVLLRTEKGKLASIHASLTQWRNIFSFEVFGKEGYAVIEGLGGSYGTERVCFGRREFDAPFAEETIEFRGADSSWKSEWEEFISALKEGRQPQGNVIDGAQAMRVILAAYEASRSGITVDLASWQPSPCIDDKVSSEFGVRSAE